MEAILPVARLAVASWILGALACSPAPRDSGAEPAKSEASKSTAIETVAIPWEDEVAAWKQNRDARLRRPDGWLTLVGFAWLEPGDNGIGSDATNRVVLPAGKSPGALGTLRLADGKVTFTVAEGATATSKGTPVTSLEMVSDGAAGEAGPTPVEHGSITFFVIERAGRLAVRVRDSEAATLASFAGLEYYPLAAEWKFEGRFEPAATPRELPIPNVLGYDEMIASPGHVTFDRAGETIRLLALDDTGDGRLFLVFGDATNGKETYGGGRFLYTAPPVDGRVQIDFNRSYNPPCVFTPYATCPLPPRENRLAFPVTAGEKAYRHHVETPAIAGANGPT